MESLWGQGQEGAGKRGASSLSAGGQGQGETDASLPKVLWKPGDGLSGS